MLIHPHIHTSETYIVLRGKIKVLFYNDNKEVIESGILDPLKGNYDVSIPKGQWHTLEVLDSGSVIFEDGPYRPIEEKDILN